MKANISSQCHDRSCSVLTIAMVAVAATAGGTILPTAAFAVPTASVGAAGVQGVTAHARTALAFASGTSTAGRIVSSRGEKGVTPSTRPHQTPVSPSGYQMHNTFKKCKLFIDNINCLFLDTTNTVHYYTRLQMARGPSDSTVSITYFHLASFRKQERDSSSSH